MEQQPTKADLKKQLDELLARHTEVKRERQARERGEESELKPSTPTPSIAPQQKPGAPSQQPPALLRESLKNPASSLIERARRVYFEETGQEANEDQIKGMISGWPLPEYLYNAWKSELEKDGSVPSEAAWRREQRKLKGEPEPNSLGEINIKKLPRKIRKLIEAETRQLESSIRYNQEGKYADADSLHIYNSKLEFLNSDPIGYFTEKQDEDKGTLNSIQNDDDYDEKKKERRGATFDENIQKYQSIIEALKNAPVLETGNEKIQLTKEIKELPEKERIKMGIGLSTLGFTVEQKKNDFFAGVFNKIVKSKKIKAGGTAFRFCSELRNSFVRDSESAKKKAEEVKSGKGKHRLANVGLLIGNVARYGRIITDATGASLASPLRYVMMGSMVFTRASEAAKETRLSNEAVIEKTRITDADDAAEEAWAIYENAQKESGNKEVSSDALKNAYLMNLPADIYNRLKDPAKANGIIQKILTRDMVIKMNFMASRIERIEENKKLSEEEQNKKKEVLIKKYEKKLRDYDRVLTQYGTIDELAMAGRYAQIFGKAVVTAVTVETLVLSVEKLFGALSHVLSSHDAHDIVTSNSSPSPAVHDTSHPSNIHPSPTATQTPAGTPRPEASATPQHTPTAKPTIEPKGTPKPEATATPKPTIEQKAAPTPEKHVGTPKAPKGTPETTKTQIPKEPAAKDTGVPKAKTLETKTDGHRIHKPKTEGPKTSTEAAVEKSGAKTAVAMEQKVKIYETGTLKPGTDKIAEHLAHMKQIENQAPIPTEKPLVNDTITMRKTIPLQTEPAPGKAPIHPDTMPKTTAPTEPAPRGIGRPEPSAGKPIHHPDIDKGKGLPPQLKPQVRPDTINKPSAGGIIDQQPSAPKTGITPDATPAPKSVPTPEPTMEPSPAPKTIEQARQAVLDKMDKGKTAVEKSIAAQRGETGAGGPTQAAQAGIDHFRGTPFEKENFGLSGDKVTKASEAYQKIYNSKQGMVWSEIKDQPANGETVNITNAKEEDVEKAFLFFSKVKELSGLPPDGGTPALGIPPESFSHFMARALAKITERGLLDKVKF